MKRSDRPRVDPPAAPRARGRRRLGTIALLALPIVFAVVLLRLRDRWPRWSDPVATMTDRDMLQNLEAADVRRDWVTALLWAERLGARRPRDSMVLRARATAWSNYAVARRPTRALERPALRTSLDRSACMRRALVLFDSAATSATTAPLWLDAMVRLAECDETLGLPGDALLVYETVKQRLPDQIAPALRAYWVRALLYDPIHPDTSAWDQHMRRIGMR